MRSATRVRSWLSATVVWSFLLVPAFAEEPVQQFLDALRERRYYDEALLYLEEMRSSPVAPASFRAIIDLERAKTLIASAGAARDRGRREALLDEAQVALETFSREQPTHPLTPEATERFADLLIRRSEMALQRARDEATPAGQRTELLDRSRTQLGQAEEILAKVREDLKSRLQRIDPKTTDPQLKAMLDDYRIRYMQVRLNLAQLKLSRGDTYDAAAEERKTFASAAETEFAEIRKAYRSFGGTFVLSTVGLAQALQVLQRYDEALQLADEILELPASPELREIQRRALVVALDALRRRDPVPYDEMISRADPIVGVLYGDEVDAPEWADLHLELATCFRESALALEKVEPKTAEDRQKIDLYLNRSEEIAKELTRGRSPLKSKAQQLLASWGMGRPVTATDVAEPVNFMQARERAVAVLNDLENARVAVTSLQSELANATDATAQADLQRRLTDAEQVIRTAPLEAMKWLERAMALADAETSAEDLSVIRRLMAYIHEIEGRYYHAGVLGERQLAEMPNSAGSRAAGKIALNSYWALYQQAPPNAREFEIAHLRSVGEALLKSFPSSDEATRAANFLALVSLAQRDRAGAEAYLAQIPESAPERTRLLAAIGSSLWWEYLREVASIDASRRSGEIDAEEARRRREALLPTLEQARTMLDAGLARLNMDNMDQAMAAASLAAAQLALSESRASDALTVLERPDLGPLSLLRAKHPAVEDSKLASEIYRTALRAYIGSAAGATDVSSQIQKARGVMTALESSIGTTEEGKASLVALYVALVSELRQQIEAIPDATQRTAFAAGVGSFLEEVQRTATDPSLLVWTAETMAGVAEALAAEGDSAQATALFEKAEATLRRTIEAGDSTSKQRAQIQLAGILRAQGQYQEAIDVYAAVLGEKQNLVSVQVEAAHTFHRWGRATRSAERLSEAMVGGVPRTNPQNGRTENVIWGWGKLAQSTARLPQFREVFFEARYQLAYARFEYAVLNASDEQLARVERDVRGTMQVDPELGGGVWRTKFDALVKTLQKRRGEPVTGLAGLREEPKE